MEASRSTGSVGDQIKYKSDAANDLPPSPCTIGYTAARNLGWFLAQRDLIMSQVATEHVLVVPTEVFRRLGYFQGFCGDVERYLRGLLDPAHTSYQPRPAMEQDPNFKQLIPYVIFRHRDAGGDTHLFQYTRGKGQGEARLHAKRSIGVGGHISADDALVASAYDEGMRRELEEEICIGSSYRGRMVGLINDDETEVGKVHLGVVHLLDVDEPAVEPREADLVDAGFRPLQELLTSCERFETWSQICLKALFS
jgi:predicted NUDIX family phosphoesterase